MYIICFILSGVTAYLIYKHLIYTCSNRKDKSFCISNATKNGFFAKFDFIGLVSKTLVTCIGIQMDYDSIIFKYEKEFKEIRQTRNKVTDARYFFNYKRCVNQCNEKGPRMFAIDKKHNVYFEDRGKWWKYTSSMNIKIDKEVSNIDIDDKYRLF